MSSSFLFSLPRRHPHRTKDFRGPLANSISLKREFGVPARRRAQILGSRLTGNNVTVLRGRCRVTSDPYGACLTIQLDPLLGARAESRNCILFEKTGGRGNLNLLEPAAAASIPVRSSPLYPLVGFTSASSGVP